MTDESPLPSPVKPTVLIVDDEQPFLEMLEQSFADDFNLATLTSAAAAEKLMALRRFEVVVCDYLMPGEMGLDFLVRCAERWPQTRRILLTGYINPELLSRSVAIADLSACLIKPVRPTELAQAIRAAMNAH
ncbi:MAG: response regulator [Opitutaceae bacterium]|jgi:DNA-binding NtrC family response regulator